ncbi:MAG TPA: YbjN domain-containing protein [Brevundimonas sp.]|nr:YbjN domain-containing protein [Brevundimonas sp.]
MRLTVLLAALALGAASPALAQTAAPKGAPVTEVRSWLTGLGGTVGEPEVEAGSQTLKVADQPLPWTLTFYNCIGSAPCDDVQYSAAFSGGVTLEQVNDWNRSARYAKAFFVPAGDGGEAGAVLQYDVVLTSSGVDQLQEPTAIWLQMLRGFAGTLVQTQQPATAAQ